jgi:predicted lysophospholipase L1 biosynthesis ABC-type transport system permease subunit
MRVVGRAVFEPTLPLHGLGYGAVITFGAGERLHLAPVPSQAFVVLDPRTTTTEAFKAGLAKTTGAPAQFASFATPANVVNFANMRALPAILAGILGVFGVATLVHAMMSVIRLRRRDLAVLKAIGFNRRQTARAVTWQATLIVAVALVAGVPLGILAGRFLWLWVVTDAGGVPVTHLPAVWLLAIAPVAIATAAIVAAIPGRRAASTPAALILRSE